MTLRIFVWLNPAFMTEEEFQTAISKPDPIEAVQDIYRNISNLPDLGDNLSRLTTAQRTVYCISSFHREVLNGGLSQYFFNSSGDYAHEVLRGFLEIGALSCAELLKDAIDSWPEETVPKNRETRDEMLFDVETYAAEKWNRINGLYSLGEEKVAELLFDYVLRHKREFI
jgi:hypothetical protein